MDQPGLASPPTSAPRAGANALLSAEELQTYHRDGFIVPRFALSAQETARLRGLIMKLVEDNPHLADFLMQAPHVPGNGVQGLKSPPGWMEFAAHPAILDIVEQIMGPDIILRGTAAFYKRPQAGPATAWHRDAQLQAIRPLASTHVWIAVTDSRIDNACLRFVPGSHKAKIPGRHIHGHLNDDGTVGPKLVDPFEEDRAVDVEVSAGQMIVHDMFTAHCSRPNLGTAERASFALRYMPGTSYYDHGGMPAAISSNGYGHHTRPLILVRGTDRAGNNFKIGHPEQAG